MFACFSDDGVFRGKAHKMVIAPFILREKHERRIDATLFYPYGKANNRLYERKSTKVEAIVETLRAARLMELYGSAQIRIDKSHCRECHLSRLTDKPWNLTDGIADRICRTNIKRHIVVHVSEPPCPCQSPLRRSLHRSRTCRCRCRAWRRISRHASNRTSLLPRPCS